LQAFAKKLKRRRAGEDEVRGGGFGRVCLRARERVRGCWEEIQRVQMKTLYSLS